MGTRQCGIHSHVGRHLERLKLIVVDEQDSFSAHDDNADMQRKPRSAA
jgi:hypothetical protein